MDEIGEIKTAINQFYTDTNWLKTRARWRDDFNLYRLKPYNAGKGYYSYTSDYPRVLADKVINMLCESELLISVPEDILTDEQQTVANNVERFLYGSLNLNDEILANLTDMPKLRDQLAWYAAIRGSVVVRPYVYKNDKGETIPEVRCWDIFNTAYGKGENGLTWAAHTYKITSKEAERLYGIETGFNTVDVIDWWDDEKYGVIVADQFGKELVEHRVGHCPVYIFRVGAMPPVWQDTYSFTGMHQGESIYAAIRGLIPSLDKLLSDYLTMVRRGVKVPLGIWSPGGQVTLDEDIWQVEKAAAVPFDINTKIEPIFKESMPQDATPLLNWMSGELQRGGLPHTAFGELGFRLSGFAINQLLGTLASVVAPFAQTLERAYEKTCLELVEQYTGEKTFPPVKVRGRTKAGQAFGYTRTEQIKPSDIAGSWHPEVKLVPVLPKDDAQRYQLARFAREGDPPLLADETIRGELLGVKDTDLENMKVDREWARKLVINRLWRAYQGAVEEGAKMEAENILKELERLLGGMDVQGKPTQAGGLSPTGQEALGSKGVGMPASVSPPEMAGGMPPGALNAQMPMFAEGEM